jgi:multidrug transporter EmrE-like cation transporter
MTTPLLILIFVTMNVFSNYCFKRSAVSQGLKSFTRWQIPAHLSGFLGVLAFTFLLRFLPVHVAYPVVQGLVVLGIQFIAARLLFKERILTVQWLGTLVLFAGLILVSK